GQPLLPLLVGGLLEQGRVHGPEQPEAVAVLGDPIVGVGERVQPGQEPVVLTEYLCRVGVVVQEDVDGSHGLVSVDRQVQALYVREEVFDAGEGGAELGDQLGQVGDEPATLAGGPCRGGVNDSPL